MTQSLTKWLSVINKGVTMKSLKEIREERETKQEVARVEEIIGTEIAVKKSVARFPAVWIVLGTVLVGGSVLLNIPILSWSLLGLHFVIGALSLRKI